VADDGEHDSRMNTSAKQASDLKVFVVSFRCHSHVVVLEGQCFKLPEFPTKDGRTIQFAIMS
jgi:hypothetical protein